MSWRDDAPSIRIMTLERVHSDGAASLDLHVIHYSEAKAASFFRIQASRSKVLASRSSFNLERQPPSNHHPIEL